MGRREANMKIAAHLLRATNDPKALAHLRDSLHPDVSLTAGADLPSGVNVQVLIAGRPQPEHLAACPNLRALVIPWAGLPEATRRLMEGHPDIAVHNLHHNALPVAEHALALLLAAAKFLVPMDRALRAGDWTPRYRANPSVVLAGKTALILGFGAIGQHLARLCQGLGMRVVAVRRSKGETHGRDDVQVFTPDALPRLLPGTDALLVCLPHTGETAGFIGREDLALLPPTAILVNVGRGPVVDEAALYEALRDGRLYAAGLDVWYDYPADEAARSQTMPSAYPFHELENVVMSPHRAGGSTETEMLRMTHLAELLNAAAQGEPMPNRVDLSVGY